MPNPTASSVHVNRPLTNIAVRYAQTGNYVAPQVFPIVPVSKQSDTYYKYDKADWLRSQAEKRAPATESAGSGFRLSTDSYFAHKRSIHKDVADEQRANQDDPINLDSDATRWVTRQIQMKMEKDWSSAFFGTGIWDEDLDGVTASPGTNQFLRWDEDGSDPVNDVTSEKIDIRSKTGYDPQIGVLSPHVTQALKNHADIIDRIKYTERGMVSMDLLAALFDLQTLLEASAIEDTSTEGASEANESPGFIHGKHMLIAYAAPNPSIMEPSGGYTFVWTGLVGARNGWQIKRFRMEEIEADRIEANSAYDQKLVASDVGAFFQDAVS